MPALSPCRAWHSSTKRESECGAALPPIAVDSCCAAEVFDLAVSGRQQPQRGSPLSHFKELAATNAKRFSQGISWGADPSLSHQRAFMGQLASPPQSARKRRPRREARVSSQGTELLAAKNCRTLWSSWLCRCDDQRLRLPFDRSIAEPSEHHLLDGLGRLPEARLVHRFDSGADQGALHGDHRCIPC